MDRQMNELPRNLFDLKGKVAVINGGSRGIGEASARALAAHGARVFVTSRKLAACEDVAESIRAAGGDCQAKACHAGNLEQLQALFADVEREYGRLDILMNNAVASPYYGPITDTDLASFDKVMETNVRGYFYACVHGAKLMAKTGGGSIINTASVFGLRPGGGDGAAIYSISKSAIITMSKTFASECATSGVRVNALLPGLTQTKFAGALLESDDTRSGLLSRIPMGRVAQPEEMAGAVVFLASQASSYMTGSLLIVDGGYTIN
jgi:NAD(P)-dependent dehydrogenase (short-subunit alcohol dehydrogenase family)